MHRLGTLSAWTSRLNPSRLSSKPSACFLRCPRINTHFFFTAQALRPFESKLMGEHKPLHEQQCGNFDLVKQIKLDYTDVSLSQWRSRKTGLTMLHLDYEAPIVKGYFVVASEIFDDTGRPHTLEHLVFMGSEQYPYKGVLDQLANRAFSAGTNAWTDTDHTAYTLATAGSQGFLQMLPIYIDHILYPTLRPSGFLTEVHHIDSEGRDSGVVYSEMQGRQNTSADLMSLKMQQILNPPGNAYRSETAGLMEALRVLTNEQIKEYHKTYYTPYNLMLIIAGRIETRDILETLQNKVESSILKHGEIPGVVPSSWKRPFLETFTSERAPLKSNVDEVVEFPEQDESHGEIYLAFSGPSPTNYLTLDAIDILGTYLTSSATAPLNKEFIEISNPLCTYIYFDIQSRATFCDLAIYAGGVPIQYLDSLHLKLRESIKGIAERGLEKDRMEMVLKREKRKFFSTLESSKGDAFSTAIIDDFLYGSRDGTTLVQSLDEMKRFEELERWTSGQWALILEKYFVANPFAVVRGKPSASLASRLASEEKARIERQVEQLGSEGLANVTEKLAGAKAEHDQPIPQGVITSFRVPDVESISWIPVETTCDYSLPVLGVTNSSHSYSDTGPSLPFFVQFENVKSDFVTVHAIFNLDKIPAELLPYLSVLQNALYSLPVRRLSGEQLSHEEVVDQLDRDTVSYDTSLGFGSSFTETARISIKVETDQYDTAVLWIRDLINGTIFDTERLKVTIAKMQQSLPEMKRDADTVLGSTIVDVMYSPTSGLRANSLLKQMEMIPYLAEIIQNDPSEVVSKLEALRNHLLDSSGIRFAVTGNITGLRDSRQPWRKYFEKLTTKPLNPVPLSFGTLNEIGINPSRKAFVVSMPSIESSYAAHTTKGILGFNHPDWPALRVAIEVLNSLESYLWRYIRGSGLAYGASIGADLEAGQLSFTIYRSPNAFRAFEEGAKVLYGLTDGSIPLEPGLVDAAKSSIVYSIARQVSTPGKAAMVSFMNQALKGVPQDHYRRLLESCQSVTLDDILESMRTHLLPIFNSDTSVAIVVSASSKADEIAESLSGAGFEVERRSIEVSENERGNESESESSSDSDSSA